MTVWIIENGSWARSISLCLCVVSWSKVLSGLKSASKISIPPMGVKLGGYLRRPNLEFEVQLVASYRLGIRFSQWREAPLRRARTARLCSLSYPDRRAYVTKRLEKRLSRRFGHVSFGIYISGQDWVFSYHGVEKFF